jgi:hypothetical protein
MATYYARKAGNINASDVWATTPSGTAAAVTFVAGDVLMANSFAVTINVSTDLGATGQVRNDTTGGATAGGSFVLSNGVTLTANVIAGGVTCVTYSGTTGNSATIAGSVTGGSTSNTCHGALMSGSGTLFISGSVTGGSTTNAAGAQNNGSGLLAISGSVTGGTNVGCNGVWNNGSGTVTVSGSCTGGGTSNIAAGALNNGNGTVIITGICSGGGFAGQIGANNASTGTMLIEGVVQASEFSAGVGGTNRAQVTLLTGPFLISPTFGVNPIGCVSWRWASALNNQTYLEVGTQTLLQKRNLVTPDNATNFPSASNVRSGTAYGIGGVLSGTCVVPNPAQVAAGTPVDNTVGTLASATAGEIATAVRSELSVELGRLDAAVSSRLAPSGTLATVTNLTNAPASVTPSDIWSHATRTLTSASGPTVVQIREELDANSTKLANLDAPVSGAGNAPSASTVATAVRTELATELARVDAAVSTRLAGSAYTAPANSDITAIKGKTDLLNTDRLAQCSTVSTTGAQLAAALS